jgi:hypothetical protein
MEMYLSRGTFGTDDLLEIYTGISVSLAIDDSVTYPSSGCAGALRVLLGTKSLSVTTNRSIGQRLHPLSSSDSEEAADSPHNEETASFLTIFPLIIMYLVLRFQPDDHSLSLFSIRCLVNSRRRDFRRVSLVPLSIGLSSSHLLFNSALYGEAVMVFPGPALGGLPSFITS